MNALTVSFDAAWGGTGWAICTEELPIWAGHIKPGRWREASLLAHLQQLDQLIVTEQIALELAPRVVIERLPWNYRRPGSQVRTVYGISGVAHVIFGWGCRRGWEYPWLIPPRDDRGKPKHGAKPRPPQPGWREWWGIRGKRPIAKARAIALVRTLGYGHLLDGLKPINAKGDGPQGDVAEAILIGLGAARNTSQAPRGPVRWPAPTSIPSPGLFG